MYYEYELNSREGEERWRVDLQAQCKLVSAADDQILNLEHGLLFQLGTSEAWNNPRGPRKPAVTQRDPSSLFSTSGSVITHSRRTNSGRSAAMQSVGSGFVGEQKGNQTSRCSEASLYPAGLAMQSSI